MGDAMIVALAAAAVSMVSYTAAGKWTMDYQQDLCLLTRPYTANGAKVTLGFRQVPGDPETEVIILSADSPDATLRRGGVLLRPDPATTMLSIGVSLRIPGGRQRLLRFMAGHDQILGLGSQARLTIEELGEGAMTFPLDRADKALRALATCEIDQIRSWGVDLAQMATPAQPIGDVATWFAFPLEPAMKNHDGNTTVRWTIDPTGAVTACTVIRSSGNPVLDKAACTQVVKHAKYQPAMGRDGKPMASIETRNLIWALRP
jgi:TonB family protein